MTSGFEAAYIYVGADAGTLYFLTTLDAPNGRIIGIDPLQPERAHWRNVIPTARMRLTSPRPASRWWITSSLSGRCTMRAAACWSTGSMAPFTGGETARAGYRRGLRRPSTGHRGLLPLQRSHHPHDRVPLRPEVREQHGIPGTEGGVYASRFEERQVFYPGKDGTRIPMTLAFLKGVRLDGRNPALLYGYGGFGVSLAPAFSRRAGVARARRDLRRREHARRRRVRRGVAPGRDRRRSRRSSTTSSPRPSAHCRALDLDGEARHQRRLQRRPAGRRVHDAAAELFGAALPSVGVLDMIRFPLVQAVGWDGRLRFARDPTRSRGCSAIRRITTCARARAIRRRS